MERLRESGSWGSKPRSSYWWNTSQNPPPAPVWTNVPDCSGERVWMRDIVTPDFRKRSALGEIINTPMGRVSESRAYNSMGPTFQTVVNGITYWGELRGGPWTANLPSEKTLLTREIPGWTSLAGTVRTKALARVAKPDFEGLVSLGELRETLGYLRNPFKTGLKLARVFEGKAATLRRRYGIAPGVTPPRGSLAWKELQNLYLEFRYGVRPLVKEVESLLSVLEGMKKRPERQTFRAWDVGQYNDTWSVPGNYSGIIHQTTFKYERTVTVRAGLLYEYQRGITSAQDQWGLHLSQLPSATWELLPLSFVVDWGLNVADFIAALTPAFGMNRLAEWTWSEVKEQITAEHRGYRYSNWATARDGQGTDVWIRVTKSRQPYVGVPSLHLQGFADVLWSDKAKILDLITLINQRIKRI